jgi:hypothetical protein
MKLNEFMFLHSYLSRIQTVLTICRNFLNYNFELNLIPTDELNFPVVQSLPISIFYTLEIFKFLTCPLVLRAPNTCYIFV